MKFEKGSDSIRDDGDNNNESSEATEKNIKLDPEYNTNKGDDVINSNNPIDKKEGDDVDKLGGDNGEISHDKTNNN